jgi:hypothetical protein
VKLRDLEAASIKRFVEKAAAEGYLSGRVLDYGCGRQPYRDIVEAAGGEYVGYDRVEFPGNVSGENFGENAEVGRFDWQAILCTQVVQYVPLVMVLLRGFKTDLERTSGALVMTYPTNWPEVEAEDLHRFTKAGMEAMLERVGFEVVLHEVRHVVRDPYAYSNENRRHNLHGEEFAIGYGVIARA